MEPEVSLPHSKASATCLYPGPAQSSPYTGLLYISRTLVERIPTVCGLTFMCDREAMTHNLVEKPQEKIRIIII